MIKYVLNEIDFFKVRFRLNFNKYPSYNSLISELLIFLMITLLGYTFYELL